MNDHRVGLWLIGALGGVGSTVALGLAALRRGLTDRTGLVTALPSFSHLDLDPPSAFMLGGHDIRRGGWSESVNTLARRIGAFEPSTVEACLPDLEVASTNIRPGIVSDDGETIAALADRPDVVRAGGPQLAFDQVQRDLRQF